MTSNGGAPRILTDDDLAVALRHIARVCLEVERGLRPPEHLTPFLDPSQQQIQPGQLGRFGGGPVRHDHVGQPQISRLTDTHAIATVITRTDEHRWGALSLELHALDGRWRIAGLQRLLASRDYRTPPAALPEIAASMQARRAEMVEARQMAEAAHAASSRRLAAIPPGSPEYREARDLVAHYQRTLRDLTRQLGHPNAQHEYPLHIKPRTR
jgi:hypothetical protein